MSKFYIHLSATLFVRVILASIFPLTLVLSTAAHSEERSGACRLEQEYIDNATSYEVSALPEDYSCFDDIDAVDLGRVTVVDTRSPNDFEKAFVPGSINLPGNFLFHQRTLKNRSLLLVNKGVLTRQNAQLCARLKEAGFIDVKIVRGGLHAWRLSGNKLAGLPEDIAALSKLTEIEFVVALTGGDAKLIAGQSWYDRVRRYVPDNIPVLPIVGEKSFAMALAKALGGDEVSRNLPVIMLEGTLEEYTESQYRNLYTYDASPETIEQHFESLAKVQEKRRSIPDRYRCRGGE
ncbi:rhodanese-like domain-containing protein [Hahella aquimaris]|uniref:rhodanese-like domain-containing protein n=1 Tax=Hahella sp. HNIBRBA332 TaxID=3015983 RepID=UPI00273B4D0C|nr:rhodanese-like domain-containing protein [Hahella sp. HNIBRBA332]WLQ16803.1 rhodanese-like domain-containing protein [Hahella sp. HNIBRBA332]